MWFGCTGGTSNHSHVSEINTTVMDHQLTVNEMPSHDHMVDTPWSHYPIMSPPGFAYNPALSTSAGSGWGIDNVALFVDAGGNQSHSHKSVTESYIDASTHLPPFVAVCYIMRTSNVPTAAPDMQSAPNMENSALC